MCVQSSGAKHVKWSLSNRKLDPTQKISYFISPFSQKNLFSKSQTSAIQDYIQILVMLHYSQQVLIDRLCVT